MTNTIKNCNWIIAFILGALLVVVLALFLREANTALGDSPGSLPPNHSTSSSSVIGTTAVRIFASSTCAARIITVFSAPGASSSAISLGFNDVVPTATNGHIQAATTTISYGAQDYGCGTIRAISANTGNVTLTITETF